MENTSLEQPLKMVRASLREFAKVANVKDRFHTEWMHASIGLIQHEIAKQQLAGMRK